MNNLQFTMYNDLQKNRLYRYICTIVNCTLYIVNWLYKLLFNCPIYYIDNFILY